MIKRDGINVKDVNRWIQNNWQLYASQDGSRLWVSLVGTFKVTEKYGILIYYGNDINRAVDLFNESIW